MAKRRSRIPDAEEFRRRWSELDRPARRRVRRATNRAAPADNRSEAALAVVFARSQQRSWKVTWPLGALLLGAVQWGQGWEVMLANAGLGAVVFGIVALLFISRGRKAEAVNLAVVDGRPREADELARTSSLRWLLQRRRSSAPSAGRGSRKAGGAEREGRGKGGARG